MKKIITAIIIMAFISIILPESAFGTNEGIDSTICIVNALDEAAAGVATSQLSMPEFDGYIVKVEKEDAQIKELVENEVLEAVDFVENTYIADSLSDIYEIDDTKSIEYIEPNYCVELLEETDDAQPAEENAVELSGINDFYYRIRLLYPHQWYLDTINSPYAWEQKITGSGVTVGIIDSGINSNHEDFSGVNIAEGYNYTDSDDCTVTYGHGTIVAGIIAAATNNRTGIAGIASGVTIVPFKCFTTKDDGYIINIVQAIYCAIKPVSEGGAGCDVINLSFGSSIRTEMLETAIKAAVDAGVIVVASAGNEGTATPIYPAAFDGVISVGSVDENNERSSFSNYHSTVDIVAPGETIISLSYDDNNGYVKDKRGTSFSAPMVTAAAALLKSTNSELSSKRIEILLESTATDLGDTGRDDYYGYGLLNIKSALIKSYEKLGLDIDKTDEAVSFSVNLADMNSDSSYQVIAAEYSSTGTLVGTKLFQGKSNEYGEFAISDEVILGSENNKIRLFVLDENCKPTCESVGA